MSDTNELVDAHSYATRLLVSLMEKHYPDRHPDWSPLPDLMGVLTQIDNLSTGLVRAPVEAVPVAWRYRSKWIRPKQGLAAEESGYGPWRYTEDRATADGRAATSDEVQPLYAHPPAQAGAVTEAQGWRDMASAPRDGTEILATLLLHDNTSGRCRWVRHIIAFDEDRGEISSDCEAASLGWVWEYYEYWQPLPTPPVNQSEGADRDA